jgi:hypothetical protein
LQKLQYSQTKFDGIAKTYVHAEKWFHVDGMEHAFRPVFERIQNEPNWTTLSWPVGHLLTDEAPAEVEQLILELSR